MSTYVELVILCSCCAGLLSVGIGSILVVVVIVVVLVQLLTVLRLVLLLDSAEKVCGLVLICGCGCVLNRVGVRHDGVVPRVRLLVVVMVVGYQEE